MNIDGRIAYFTTPEGRKEYSEWLRDPMTVRVLSIMNNLSKPLGGAAVTSESALYNLGLYVGMASIMQFIENVDTAALQLTGQSEEVEANFGADTILAQYYKTHAGLSAASSVRKES